MLLMQTWKKNGDSSYAMTSFENVQSAYQSAFQGEYIRKVENGMGTAAAQAIISAELKKCRLRLFRACVIERLLQWLCNSD